MVLGSLIESKTAAREHQEIHDVKQTEEVIPQLAFHEQACELVPGVNKFDLDLWVQVDSVKQPVKCNSVGSGHVSHRRTSALYAHFDHSFIVLKSVMASSEKVLRS